jgi:hypothetical protein
VKSASPTIKAPEIGESPGGDDDGGGAPADAPAATSSEPSIAAAPAAGSCTDAEIKLTPVPNQTTFPAGQTIAIRFKIKNESTRTCTRDVGADLQEIYIKFGASTVWSSDTCGGATGTDPQPFAPNFEREYTVAWNGRLSTTCANGLANGKVADPGEYQLIGRLGTDLSSPVKLTLS